MTQPLYAFFGSDELSICVLNELVLAGLQPAVIITVPDSPQGRKLVMTPTPLKLWAIEHNIPILDPENLRDKEFISSYSTYNVEFAVVASYGKIIPDNVLNIPKRKTLNVHPSLLPELRGPSPLQNTILGKGKPGVSIMRLDSEMDHGPLLAQSAVEIPDFEHNPPYYSELRDILGKKGGEMLADVLPRWLAGEVTETEQDHSRATHCSMVEKNDALVNISGDPFTAVRKVRAFSEWPRAYFFIKKDNKDFRITITRAHTETGKLVIEKVIPEGKNEMDFESFERGYVR